MYADFKVGWSHTENCVVWWVNASAIGKVIDNISPRIHCAPFSYRNVSKLIFCEYQIICCNRTFNTYFEWRCWWWWNSNSYTIHKSFKPLKVYVRFCCMFSSLHTALHMYINNALSTSKTRRGWPSEAVHHGQNEDVQHETNPQAAGSWVET